LRASRAIIGIAPKDNMRAAHIVVGCRLAGESSPMANALRILGGRLPSRRADLWEEARQP
jgi:hypothetical protein